MIRVKRNRCGYDEWSCVGVPSLDPVFTGYGTGDEDSDSEDVKLVCDDGFEPSEIDNYYNLPQAVRGFTMIQEIPDGMDLAPLPLAESECYPDLGLNNFLDLYSVYKPYVNLPIYAVQDSTGSKSSADLNGGYICFRDAMTTDPSGAGSVYEPLVLEPGLLEPMIGSDLPNVPITTPPAWGRSLDGLLIPLIGLMKWKELINQLLSEILGKLVILPHIQAIRNSVKAMLTGPACNSFRISVVSGSPIRWPRDGSSEPVFSVSSGSVNINGIVKNGISGIASFTVDSSAYIYLRIANSNNDSDKGKYQSTSVSLIKSASKLSGSGSISYVEIGSIIKKDANVDPKYTIWQIHQANCDIDTDKIRPSKSGVLTYGADGANGGGSGTDASPFGALDTGECDE